MCATRETGKNPRVQAVHGSKRNGEAHMFNAFTMRPPRDWVTWCACALLVLMPGSFVVLPLVWVGRRVASRVTPPKTLPYARPEKAEPTKAEERNQARW
jgi:hypothetical protein